MSNDLLFPQFLLSRGVLDAAEVRIFLERMLTAKVDVPVQALFHGVATAAIAKKTESRTSSMLQERASTSDILEGPSR